MNENEKIFADMLFCFTEQSHLSFGYKIERGKINHSLKAAIYGKNLKEQYLLDSFYNYVNTRDKDRPFDRLESENSLLNVNHYNLYQTAQYHDAYNTVFPHHKFWYRVKAKFSKSVSDNQSIFLYYAMLDERLIYFDLEVETHIKYSFQNSPLI